MHPEDGIEEEGLSIRMVLERLRALSPPLRYLAYVAGAILVVLVAAGVGATAALMIDGRPEWATSGHGSPGAGGIGEGTTSAKTGEAAKPKAAELGATGDARDANPDEGKPGQEIGVPLNETAFTHTATNENSRGDYTYISDPAIDGDPDAIVLVVRSTDRQDAKGATYAHNIGVWYEGAHEKRWAIFNQDRAVVPAGTTFEVTVPPASEAFVHFAAPLNTVGDRTYLDNPLTNGEPDAVPAIVQNWNPGGGRGVYNDHPIGVVYDADRKRWAIYNKNGAPIPDGVAFNIAVSGVPTP
jgi:hypothetical protein